MLTQTSSADIAWLLAAFTFVLIMIPGVGLFYGGMVGQKSALNTIMMCMGALAAIPIICVLYGHGLVVGDSLGGWGLIGNPRPYLGFIGNYNEAEGGEPSEVYILSFFILFAAVTICIAASGVVGRMKFSAWLVFAVVWITLVYFPVAHWVFIPDTETSVGGWMRNTLKMHDYGGGTAVHMTSGFAALALAVVLGKRRGPHTRPHNLPLVILGASLICMGWMGFNAGNSGAAGFTAQYVIMTTLLAASAGMIGFCLVERIRDGHATSLGMASGLVAGLVGITPAADAVDALGAFAVGCLAGAFVAWACTWKRRWGIDESLDAFAVHGMGGIVGTVCVVLFGFEGAPAGIKGILFGGSWDLIWRELIGVTVTCTYAFIMTFLIAKILDKVIGLRIKREEEWEGIDISEHAETGYDLRVDA